MLNNFIIQTKSFS